MNNDFTIQEKIELIVNFCSWYGYILETIDEYPVAKRFIEAGYAELDDDNVYKINPQGIDYLHPDMKNISEELITIMKKNNCVMAENEIMSWFRTTYKLSDAHLVSAIKEYIKNNLCNYGYFLNHVANKEKYVLEELQR